MLGQTRIRSLDRRTIAPQSLIIAFGYGSERGSYADLFIAEAILGPFLVNALIQCALAALFVRRYSRKLSSRAAETTAKTARPRWRPWNLRLPGASGIALAWLTLRQAVPMCLPGLAIAGIMAILQMQEMPAHGGPQAPLLRRYADALPSSMWIIGLLWAVVVGAGLFSAEIDWRIGEFWRTRPISPWRLFGVKFVVGLSAVLLVLDGTAIAATWHSPHWGEYHAMNWPYIACIVPLHAMMFAIAVAWTCVLRRAVLGGMAALATFMFLTVALEWSQAARAFDPVQVYNHLAHEPQTPDGSVDFTAHGFPVVAAIMGLTVLISILVGWRALGRYDPHRQSG